MDVTDNKRQAQTLPGWCILVPGNHDGVHLGHRALLDEARRLAHKRRAFVLALTFHPHPLEILAPEKAPMPLTTANRRVELLRLLGADDVKVQRFNHTFASLSPEAFIQDVLIKELRTDTVVVGPDFRFGYGRSGTVQTLMSMGQAQKLKVKVVAPVVIDGSVVSSSRVRAAVTAGDMASASLLLDRLHEVTGTVIEGDHRGRLLGFPTANLKCEPVLLPKDGVYAVKVRQTQGSLPIISGVANIGIRPTFEAGRSIEVHLLAECDNLYGENLRVGFIKRIRDEMRFQSPTDLVHQIQRDVKAAHEAIASVPAHYDGYL